MYNNVCKWGRVSGGSVECLKVCVLCEDVRMCVYVLCVRMSTLHDRMANLFSYVPRNCALLSMPEVYVGTLKARFVSKDKVVGRKG